MLTLGICCLLIASAVAAPTEIPESSERGCNLTFGNNPEVPLRSRAGHNGSRMGDGDGRLSHQELRGFFKKADTNNDDFVDWEEFLARTESNGWPEGARYYIFRKMDIDNDEKIRVDNVNCDDACEFHIQALQQEPGHNHRHHHDAAREGEHMHGPHTHGHQHGPHSHGDDSSSSEESKEEEEMHSHEHDHHDRDPAHQLEQHDHDGDGKHNHRDHHPGGTVSKRAFCKFMQSLAEDFPPAVLTID